MDFFSSSIYIYIKKTFVEEMDEGLDGRFAEVHVDVGFSAHAHIHPLQPILQHQTFSQHVLKKDEDRNKARNK